MENNENVNLCKECGGECCKQIGGHYSPKDFEQITVKSLKEHIDKGYTSIDWWEGDVKDGPLERTYYLRARNYCANVVDPSWGGACGLLTPQGCQLPFSQRPYACKALLPKSDGKCKQTYSKKQCCLDWYNHQSVLSTLHDYYIVGQHDEYATKRRIIRSKNYNKEQKKIQTDGLGINCRCEYANDVPF